MKVNFRSFLLAFLLLILSLFSCGKDEEIESDHNWKPLTSLTAKTTKEIYYGKTTEGFRIDIYFGGPVTGDFINGYMSGIDYYTLRTDEADLINAYATIITDDEALIAVHITGFVYDDGSIQDEIVSLQSSHENYKWLNESLLTGNGSMTSDTSFKVEYFYNDN